MEYETICFTLLILTIAAVLFFGRGPHEEGDEWHDYRQKRDKKNDGENS